MVITILIVDDHQLFRQGLIKMLGGVDDFEVLAEARNGTEAIEKTRILKPDVILMDIGMPEISGVEATRYIRQHYPETKIIALTMHADKHYVQAMLAAGVHGYLFKNCTYAQLVEGITQVHQGKKYLDGMSTEILIDSYLGQDEQEASQHQDPRLSGREFEVLKLYAEGKSTKEISERLFISVKTVGSHKQNICEKLGLSSTADMIKYALRNGITEL